MLLTLLALPAITVLLLGSAANYNIKHTKMPLRVRRGVIEPSLETEPNNIITKAIHKKQAEDLVKSEMSGRISENNIDNLAHKEAMKSHVFEKLFRYKREKRSFWTKVSNMFHAVTGTEPKIRVVITEKPTNFSGAEKFRDATKYNNLNNNNVNKVYGSDYTIHKTAQDPNYSKNNHGQADPGLQDVDGSIQNPDSKDLETTEVPLILSGCIIGCGAMRCPDGYRQVANLCLIKRG